MTTYVSHEIAKQATAEKWDTSVRGEALNSIFMIVLRKNWMILSLDILINNILIKKGVCKKNNISDRRRKKEGSCNKNYIKTVA